MDQNSKHPKIAEFAKLVMDIGKTRLDTPLAYKCLLISPYYKTHAELNKKYSDAVWEYVYSKIAANNAYVYRIEMNDNIVHYTYIKEGHILSTGIYVDLDPVHSEIDQHYSVDGFYWSKTHKEYFVSRDNEKYIGQSKSVHCTDFVPAKASKMPMLHTFRVQGNIDRDELVGIISDFNNFRVINLDDDEGIVQGQVLEPCKPMTIFVHPEMTSYQKSLTREIKVLTPFSKPLIKLWLELELNVLLWTNQ